MSTAVLEDEPRLSDFKISNDRRQKEDSVLPIPFLFGTETSIILSFLAFCICRHAEARGATLHGGDLQAASPSAYQTNAKMGPTETHIRAAPPDIIFKAIIPGT